MDLLPALFLVIVAAVVGGVFAKLVKGPPLVGYILAGVLFGALLPLSFKSVSNLAQIGIILLLFSIGVELSFPSMARYFKVAVFGSLIQITLTTLLFFAVFSLIRIPLVTSLIFAMGFSLSSTAVIVKILSDRGELSTIHGGIMLGWSLVQDLAVIPIMVILPVVANSGGNVFLPIVLALGKAVVVVAASIFLGKMIVPFLIHKIAATNSRELLLLTSVGLALGTAFVTSFFGISIALGAFLAGVVISESQENHAVFAETRPLRDLFVAFFFVSLGFLVNPSVVLSGFPLIIFMAFIVLIIKALVIFAVSVIFGYKGKTAVSVSFGLAQVGEFAFVLFSASLALSLLTPQEASYGIAVTLLTLVVSPILIRFAMPFWRWLKSHMAWIPGVSSVIMSGEKAMVMEEELKEHIIICGYGRVGKWVGKALSDFKIPFLVVDYDQRIVNDLKQTGTPVLYGDPTEPEVLEAAGIKNAKAIVLAIPDRVAQETLVTYVQTFAPGVKIISRVHEETDMERFRALRVDKIVQPEFEAALAIVKSVLQPMGKTKEEISTITKSLRVSHSR